MGESVEIEEVYNVEEVKGKYRVGPGEEKAL